MAGDLGFGSEAEISKRQRLCLQVPEAVGETARRTSSRALRFNQRRSDGPRMLRKS